MWLTCYRCCHHCLFVDAHSLLRPLRPVVPFALSVHLRSAQCLSIARGCRSIRSGTGLSESVNRPGCLASSGLGHYHTKPFSINIFEISFNSDPRLFVRMPHSNGTLSNRIMPPPADRLGRVELRYQRLYSHSSMSVCNQEFPPLADRPRKNKSESTAYEGLLRHS